MITKNELFDISGKKCVITGGSGLLGKIHAEAVLIGGGIPILLGRSQENLENAANGLLKSGYKGTVEYFACDITDKEQLENVCEKIVSLYGGVDILINNAANNPKVEDSFKVSDSNGFVSFSLDAWNDDLRVGLTGALMCCQVFGRLMEKQNSGVILNISSDYGIIAPDQRMYENGDPSVGPQKIKPVSYSVVKHGIIGLTKYLATYWAGKGIRCNTLCPSGVYNGQDDCFVSKYTNTIPLGRMSKPDDYTGSVLYMISDASSFMNGATVVVDGGRTIW